MYETVLVPTDGSEIANRAAEEALTVTDPDGTIHVLAVEEALPFGAGPESEVTVDGETRTSQRAHLETAIETVASVVEEAGLDCERAIRAGVPYEEITAHAASVDADAIVMGKRGQGAVSDDMLGSTSERVITRASAPVVVIPVMMNLRRFREERGSPEAG